MTETMLRLNRPKALLIVPTNFVNDCVGCDKSRSLNRPKALLIVPTACQAAPAVTVQTVSIARRLYLSFRLNPEILGPAISMNQSQSPEGSTYRSDLLFNTATYRFRSGRLNRPKALLIVPTDGTLHLKMSKVIRLNRPKALLIVPTQFTTHTDNKGQLASQSPEGSTYRSDPVPARPDVTRLQNRVGGNLTFATIFSTCNMCISIS